MVKISRETKYLIIGVLLLIIFLWWTRFQTFSTSNYALRMNRFTGRVSIMGNPIRDLHTEKEKKKIDEEAAKRGLGDRVFEEERKAPEPAPAPAPEPDKKKP